MNIRLLTFDVIDSTNTEALRQARMGADEGLCVVARQQTAGRGRQGRTWVSEKDAGLYFSMVLRPGIENKFFPLVTLMAGVAVRDTLAEIGIESDIKWVNDIHVDEKKIAGILAETTETDAGLAIVVGIGINLRSTNTAGELATSATSIESSIGRTIPHDELVGELTRYLVYFYGILSGDSGPSAIIDEWRCRSSYFAGKPVRVVLEKGVESGLTDGLEENGALRVLRDDGSVAVIQAGDVHQLRPQRS